MPVIRGSFRNYLIPILLFLVSLLQFVLTDKIFLTIFKELVSTSFLLFVFIVLSVIIDTENKLKQYLENLLFLIAIFAFIVSIFNFFVIFDILSFRDFVPLNLDYIGKKGETLDIDNNFASIPIFFGLIILLFHPPKPLKKSGVVSSIFLFAFFTMNVILSASKRGIVLLFILVIIATGIIIIKYLKVSIGNNSKNSFEVGAGNFLFSLILLVVFSGSFLFLTDYRFKSKFFGSMGSRNINGSFHLVTSNILEYTQVLNLNISFSDLYRLMWNPSDNPYDPDSGWGTRVHKTINHLTGFNVEIVPEGSKGYMLDNTCNASVREGNAYAYTLIGSENAVKEVVTGATVYCFVSEDFDGFYAMMAFEAESEDYQRVSYDMSKKGTWQKLTLNFTYKKGEFPTYLYIAKLGETDFSAMKGYVIFAHPVINTPESNDNSAPHVLKYKKSIETEYNDKGYGNPSFLINKSICYKGSDPTINLLGHYQIFNIGDQPLLKKGSFFLNFILPVNRPLFSKRILQSHADLTNSTTDRDPFRLFISKLVREDSTYLAPGKMKIQSSDDESAGFIQMRVQRWRFAARIFFEEYSFGKKMFGGGYCFINWYGARFLNDRTKSDWPHNPFLSVLLYSGILGLSLFCFFMYRVFYYYIKYIKVYPIFFIFFIITFFFSFFSGGSPFDPPIMGFFSILPFFIHSVHKRADKVSKISK